VSGNRQTPAGGGGKRRGEVRRQRGGPSVRCRGRVEKVQILQRMFWDRKN
jgi:hypothetical protein